MIDDTLLMTIKQEIYQRLIKFGEELADEVSQDIIVELLEKQPPDPLAHALSVYHYRRLERQYPHRQLVDGKQQRIVREKLGSQKPGLDRVDPERLAIARDELRRLDPLEVKRGVTGKRWARCHPDKPYHAKDLCKNCYETQSYRRRKNKEKN